MKIKLDNKVELSMILGKERTFRGFGRIAIGPVVVRGGQLPLQIHLRTANGIVYTRYRLRGVKTRGTATGLMLDAIGYRGAWSEFRDEYDTPLVPLEERLGEEVVDPVEWILRPEAVMLGGVRYKGFSYSVRFSSSKGRAIHQALFETSWELGGRATGNTILSQGQLNPPVYHATRSSFFSTACFKTLEQVSGPQSFSYQLLPRCGNHQCFDFLYNKDGSLFLHWPALEDVRSLVQKNKGEDFIRVYDQHVFTESRSRTTAPKFVMFAESKQPLAVHEARNRWFSAYEHAQGHACRQFGVQRTAAVSEAAIVVHTVPEGEPFKFVAPNGSKFQPSEYLDYVADMILPDFARRGIRRFFPDVIVSNDISELGGVSHWKRDDFPMASMQGDVHVGSACCVQRYLPSKFFGGMRGWKRMHAKARRFGIEVGHWLGNHISGNAPILRQHPEFVMIGANSQRYGGGYPNTVVCAVDWNSGFAEWVLEDLRHWKREGGLECLFFDSAPNLGLLGQNYAARMRTNFHAFGRFLKRLQGIGIRSFLFEGISPWGTGRFGSWDPLKGKVGEHPGFVGQNDWDWWVGNEDMLFNQTPHPGINPRRTREEVRQILFRALANRVVVPHATYDYHLLNTLQPLMQRRYILSRGLGVLWRNGRRGALFSYRNSSIGLPQTATVCKVEGAKRHRLGRLNVIDAQPWAAYELDYGKAQSE